MHHPSSIFSYLLRYLNMLEHLSHSLLIHLMLLNNCYLPIQSSNPSCSRSSIIIACHWFVNIKTVSCRSQLSFPLMTFAVYHRHAPLFEEHSFRARPLPNRFGWNDWSICFQLYVGWSTNHSIALLESLFRSISNVLWIGCPATLIECILVCHSYPVYFLNDILNELILTRTAAIVDHRCFECTKVRFHKSWLVIMITTWQIAVVNQHAHWYNFQAKLALEIEAFDQICLFHRTTVKYHRVEGVENGSQLKGGRWVVVQIGRRMWAWDVLPRSYPEENIWHHQ